jgi:hypothetical protein
MAETIYLLCAIASVACAVLLLKGYRSNRTRLLLWSGFCFIGLAMNNILLFVDLVLVPGVDLRSVRGGVALAGVWVLLFGMIWDSR